MDENTPSKDVFNNNNQNSNTNSNSLGIAATPTTTVNTTASTINGASIDADIDSYPSQSNVPTVTDPTSIAPTSNANHNGLPDVIHPGMTIPIYEDENQGLLSSSNNNSNNNSSSSAMDGRSPQKLGSYRSRAGKLSNTLSNLLPSISAKLHHSKKGSKNNISSSSNNIASTSNNTNSNNNNNNHNNNNNASNTSSNDSNSLHSSDSIDNNNINNHNTNNNTNSNNNNNFSSFNASNFPLFKSNNKNNMTKTSVPTFGGIPIDIHSGSTNNTSNNSNFNSTNSYNSYSQNINSNNHLSTSQDFVDGLIHFPDSTNSYQPRTSNDSFTRTSMSNSISNTNSNSNSNSNNLMSQLSRTRNNTISSQLSAISSIAPSQTPSMLWQTNTNTTTNNNNDPSYQILQQFNGTSLNDTTLIPQDFPSFDTTNNNNGNNANNNNNNNNNNSNSNSNSNSNNNNNNIHNTSPNNNLRANINHTNSLSGLSLWPNPRQRSQSNASSIYTDAQMFEQQSSVPTTNNQPNLTNGTVSRQRAATNYTIPIVQEIPSVIDDIDPRAINWVSTDKNVPFINQITTLLPTNTISISNIFSLQQQQLQLANAINLTSTSLVTLCSKYGNVITARTLSGLNMALVEFDTVESAARALDDLQNKEVSMIGAPSTVCFAKILPMHQQQSNLGVPNSSVPLNSSLLNNEMLPQTLLQEQLYSGALSFQQQGGASIPVFNSQQQTQQTQHSTMHSNSISIPSHNHSNNSNNNNNNMNQIQSNEKEQCPFPLPPPNIIHQKDIVKEIVNSFEIDFNKSQTIHILMNAFSNTPTANINDFGPLPDPLNTRDFDSPKLRELRKNIDANQINDIEIEQLAMAMLNELPELSSDYIGNTIVQKLFEHSSDIIKDIMLRKTNKYLTSMGVHKNGTWACQKMITMARTPRQKMLVGTGVEAYCTPLFNDQFGNYVIQCVLKYGFPWNNFIFESIVTNFWTISQNRYGARAVRACLEAHDIVTTEQTLVLSAMIILYAEYLTTNTNGTLLVTWFLDTCILPHRHTILAKKIVPNIVELCCHRLASLTVLKILNFRGDDEARNTILNSIFGPISDEEEDPPKLLNNILSDTNYGPTFVYKVLSMPLLEGDVRFHVIKQVRKILPDCKAAQHHRRLMEEVGLAQLNNGMSQNGQPKHRVSMSHVFNHDNNKHMRHLSVSSVRSSNSRQTAPLSNASTTNTNTISTGGQHPPVSLNGQPANNMIPGTSSTPVTQGKQNPPQPYNMNYMNYPGVFPNSYVNTSNGPNSTNVPGTFNINDDLTSQFDMLSVNNNDTRVSLPQITINNNLNSSGTGLNNIPDNTPTNSTSTTTGNSNNGNPTSYQTFGF
ncbi:hypothetical protein TBLA_0I02500 [Henningerozyma blattae CBS 6284]|uniref:PUM-HD domain-containing protein n=1 Tax=Henningerozyma blattae (strain ATCC 34711 / CBS 6284 / DSM 70876 / NBRC 10599 / NRRL Y-10934 / UCD 77-7) TaxID=1071380 RepID=I2H956_HENB6|nr:hypothetical protein TBLA_0I02500 [Tetrapisispora blattae CBS 6284]CCH62908.1 hypothetical protein TBLA_0I02500 [Tetrapisispora blattae CBS 6284]